MRSFLSFFAIMAGLFVVHGFAPAAAQIPDKFTNLTVLPKDISKDELVALMRAYSSGLGVRCNHCHVGGSEGDLTGMDFASDEKEDKKIAREMIKMVNEINGTLQKSGIKDPIAVKCATCHHGVKHPESLADITKRKFEKDGLDAAKTHYMTLKEKYYGSDSYDFKPRTLNDVAEWLADEREDTAAAVEMMQFNIELAPGVASSHNLLGRIHVARGDTAAAVMSFQKALELDPEDKSSKRMLEKIQPK